MEEIAEFARARECSEIADRLWSSKPRTMRQLFGSLGPSPEQLATYNETYKAWSREYRAARKAQKAAIEASNAKYQSMTAQERHDYYLRDL